MNQLHAKSPCCQVSVIRFGNRRRQCTRCQRTWRIRQKRRGRKSRRVTADRAIRFLKHQEVPSLGLSSDQRHRRLQKSRAVFLTQTAWPRLPRARPLICIADAMIQRIGNHYVTFYFFLVRPVMSNQAVIARPVILRGTETAAGWYRALNQLPLTTRSAIVALVSDGHRGLISIARRQGWLLQRCHFHLLASIQGRRSKSFTSRHRRLGQRLYREVVYVLTEPTISELELADRLERLERIAEETSSPGLERILYGFIKHHADYRTYLNYPDLCLPRTSNTAESLIGLIRAFCHRAKGFRTLRSRKRWIEVLIKERRTITCQSSLPTKFPR